MTDSPPPPARVRRTQQQRRATTRQQLLDATISMIAEVGYARVSVKTICDRAGVSHGALFGHFDSKNDLVIAAAIEVTTRLQAAFDASLVNLQGEDDDPLVAALRAMRAVAHSDLNAVWIELLVAARTDSGLREPLAVAAQQSFVSIIGTASELPLGDGLDEASAIPLLAIALELFVGSATLGVVTRGDPERQLRIAAAVARAPRLR